MDRLEVGQAAFPHRVLPGRVGPDEIRNPVELVEGDRGLRARQQRQFRDHLLPQVDHSGQGAPGRAVEHDDGGFAAERRARLEREHLGLGRFVQDDFRKERVRRHFWMRAHDPHDPAQLISRQRIERMHRGRSHGPVTTGFVCGA